MATIIEYESTVAPRRTLVSRRIDDDAELVQSLRRSEPAAADRLIVTYQSRAYRLAFGITGNAQDAEEVVQDSFWSVVRKIESFRGDAAFGSWLYRIVANAAYQKLRGRRRQREAITLDEVLPVFDGKGRHATPCTDWSAIVDDPCRNIELRLALTAALEELPAHYRTALVLRDVEGLAVAEIAETLSLSVENVKSRVHRARLFVRKRLTESPAVCPPRWTSRAMERMANLSPMQLAAVLISARFLPGANPVAAGLAGASRTTPGRYLLYAIGTSVIWAST